MGHIKGAAAVKVYVTSLIYGLIALKACLLLPHRWFGGFTARRASLCLNVVMHPNPPTDLLSDTPRLTLELPPLFPLFLPSCPHKMVGGPSLDWTLTKDLSHTSGVLVRQYSRW